MGRKSALDWEGIFKEFLLSGKSRREYCREKGVAFSTFSKYFLRYKIDLMGNEETILTVAKKSAKNQVWVEAKLPNMKSECENKPTGEQQSVISQPLIEIIAGNFKITVSQFDIAMLGEIIGAVGRLC